MKTMTKLFFGLLVILFGLTSFKPGSGEFMGISPIDSYTQQIFGKNVGYYLTLKNKTTLKCDAVKWKAYFYDNFNDMVGIRNGQWSSGNYIKPVGPNGFIEDLEAVWVDGATHIKIVVNRVHFTNGESYSR